MLAKIDSLAVSSVGWSPQAKFLRRQPLDHLHRSTTDRASPHRRIRGSCRSRAGGRNGCRQQFEAQRHEFFASAVGKQSEVADAHESGRQYMQEKSPQKFMHAQSHRALFVTVPGIPPTERHAMIFKRQQTVRRDGNAVRITTQVTHHMFGSAKWAFRVNYPVFLMDGSKQFRNSPRSSERSQHALQHQRSGRVQLTRPSVNLPRNTFASTFTGRKKRGDAKIHRV